MTTWWRLGRWWLPPGRSTSRSPRRWRTSSTLRSTKCTAPITETPSRCHQAGCWLSAPRTLAARSRRSSPRPTRSSSPAEHGSRPSRSGRWAATCGGGPAELRLDRVTVDSRLGKRLAGRDQRIGVGPRHLARRHGVRIRPRATNAAGRTVSFADGATADIRRRGVGDRIHHQPLLDRRPRRPRPHGRLVQKRGVTPSPGLYTVGLTWQHTRGSALLGWVGADAAYLADQITSRKRTAATRGRPSHRPTRRCQPARRTSRSRRAHVPNHPSTSRIRSGCAASFGACAGWRLTRTVPHVRASSCDGSMRCWTLISGETQFFQQGAPMHMTAQAAHHCGAATLGGAGLSVAVARHCR